MLDYDFEWHQLKKKKRRSKFSIIQKIKKGLLVLFFLYIYILIFWFSVILFLVKEAWQRKYIYKFLCRGSSRRPRLEFSWPKSFVKATSLSAQKFAARRRRVFEYQVRPKCVAFQVSKNFLFFKTRWVKFNYL